MNAVDAVSTAYGRLVTGVDEYLHATVAGTRSECDWYNPLISLAPEESKEDDEDSSSPLSDVAEGSHYMSMMASQLRLLQHWCIHWQRSPSPNGKVNEFKTRFAVARLCTSYARVLVAGKKYEEAQKLVIMALRV